MDGIQIKPVTEHRIARWVWQLQLHCRRAAGSPAEPLTQSEWLVLWRLRRQNATPLSVALETGLTPATVRDAIASLQYKYLCPDIETLKAVVTSVGMPARPAAAARPAPALSRTEFAQPMSAP